ncbi:glycosyltransferase family 1 protein [Nodosilinea sp. LEGE 06152]|uniref:glycosyltransferase n=1 Tax=Nodosilinea sp. LEGE 06152 TaxID=2777966 RepID=UPI00187EF0C8|nr:glycosyltransferase [Nodosilinea sp. LEGE 06152]MBE9158061.1 glycosyltransferase family 1 protein [Nodosilinea sp. LEGE 06152]
MAAQKILLVALGSTGDVMPMCALAQGLKQAGYRPKLITHSGFQTLVEAYGFEFASLAGDYRQFFNSEEGHRFVRGEFLPWMSVPQFQANLPTQLEQVLAAAHDVAAIVTGPLSLWVYHIAEKLNLPMVVTSAIPIAETGYFPFVDFGEVPSSVNALQAALNRASYGLVSLLGWPKDQDIINRFRAAHQLPELSLLGPRFRLSQPKILQHIPILHLYSEAVLPAPPDWAESSHPTYVTGYCFVTPLSPYQPTAELEAFLAAGEPPVAIGFGSMAVDDPPRMARLLLEAVQLAQVRALWIAGWGDNQSGYLTEQVYAVQSIPHDWILPRCAAVVHHGGSGTVAAGLRAGIPAVVVPFFGDQPAWGRRLNYLGVAPPPIPVRQLTAQNLAAAIRGALDTPSMGQQASKIAAAIRSEQGVNQAASIIDDFVSSAGW